MEKCNILFLIFVFSVFLIDCGNNAAGPDTTPSLSNLTIPANLILTCYPYKGFSSRKDSVKISFDYNSRKIPAFNIEGSIDTGKTWFPLTQKSTSAANHEDFFWYPKHDSSNQTFKFCDEKKCVIRVTSNLDTLMSSEFYLIGSRPAQLIQPLQGVHFSISDSLPLEFNSNSDLLSNIDTWYFVESYTDRTPLSKEYAREVVTEGTNANIRKFNYYFQLQHYADNFTESTTVISVMISDYQQSGFYQIVDSITIAKP
ncbi:MAG: hypothetical protein JW915_07905 [Chitinispirillaceae bacterium]|nr:hypothetical protein [Chitinispirillaceae bacterium]